MKLSEQLSGSVPSVPKRVGLMHFLIPHFSFFLFSRGQWGSLRASFFSLMQQKNKKWTHMEGGLMDETGLNVTSGQQVLEVAEAKILFLFFATHC